MGSKDKVGSLHFNDVQMPGSAVLGAVNAGFAHAMPFIYDNRAYVHDGSDEVNLAGAARNILRKFVVPGDIW
jgi:alkylation response protein AidB-like acyl-CoA dehydrogenase